ncbi:MAG: uroporphyrinogen-III C-methyltransferase [Thermodesulfobacteriota bacterium]
MTKTYLVGAGPGDPGLLTLKARDVLAAADVVVYDYLANESMLQHCGKDTEFIYAGKRGGEHTLSQEEINSLLVEKAKSGATVARLKGGDPYVFGRGAEEVEELREAGVEVEIVPGITSAVAALAYAGIPLTHRKCASSACLITGHEDPNKPESVHNWQSLANSSSTLVFFMGVKKLHNICNNLLQNGLDPQTPAALVRWGTTCMQESLFSTVSDIPEQGKSRGFRPPALLVIGDVVKMKQGHSWFEKKPLLGRGVIVTRAREQASSLRAILEDMGACVYQFPTIAIQPMQDYSSLRQCIWNIRDYKWIVFTSVNGVKYFWEQLEEMDLDSRSLAHCGIAAIGPATADRLVDKGIKPDFVPDTYVAESIVKGLLDRGVQGEKVLIPRAEKAREVLPEQLQEAGAAVDVLPVYKTVLAEESSEKIRQAIEQGSIQYITFTSSSTVENFFQLFSPGELATYVPDKIKLACIGPITANTLENYGFKADIIPEEYTIPGLAAAIDKFSHY